VIVFSVVFSCSSYTAISDQSRAADLAKARRARAMTPFEKFDAGASLFEEACAWSLAGIAHQHPEWDAVTRHKELRRRLKLAT
jgi:hypothetical protein